MDIKVLHRQYLSEAEPYNDVLSKWFQLHQPGLVENLLNSEKEYIKTLGIKVDEKTVINKMKKDWPWYKRLFWFSSTRKLNRAKTILNLIQEDK